MTPLVCASGVELLMDYLEGVLSADVSAALDAHVAGCERCTAFVASYRATPRILRDSTTMTLPADLEASLKAFLRSRTGAFKDPSRH
jgi:anti-sigma factor RsiW